MSDGISAPKRLTPSIDPLLVPDSPHPQCPCTVLVWAVVDRDGRVRRAKVIRPVSDDLDEAAIQQVKTWTFDPAKYGNTPVAVEINLEVKFR